MHILMTVNAAWNIWNFRRPLVEALAADGHRITVLALPNLIARGRGARERCETTGLLAKVPFILPLHALPGPSACAKLGTKLGPCGTKLLSTDARLLPLASDRSVGRSVKFAGGS